MENAWSEVEEARVSNRRDLHLMERDKRKTCLSDKFAFMCPCHNGSDAQTIAIGYQDKKPDAGIQVICCPALLVGKWICELRKVIDLEQLLLNIFNGATKTSSTQPYAFLTDNLQYIWMDKDYNLDPRNRYIVVVISDVSFYNKLIAGLRGPEIYHSHKIANPMFQNPNFKPEVLRAWWFQNVWMEHENYDRDLSLEDAWASYAKLDRQWRPCAVNIHRSIYDEAHTYHAKENRICQAIHNNNCYSNTWPMTGTPFSDDGPSRMEG